MPFDDTLCFSSIAMTQAAPFAGALVAALEAQGITVEQYYPELGHGQHELSIRHAEVLRAADNYIKLRETIRGVAPTGNMGCMPRWHPNPSPTRPAMVRTFTSACGMVPAAMSFTIAPRRMA